MKYSYRFLRTKAGKTYFARVGLEIQAADSIGQVVEALPEQVNTDEGEINRQIAPTWVDAALDGSRTTVAYARQTGVNGTGCRIVLDQLVGSPVDTREDVLRCAAGLAVWDALGAPGPAPEAEFDGQQWKLVFPARIPSAVQETSR